MNKRFIRSFVPAAVGVASFLATQARAAVPTEVSTAITGAGTDGATVAGLVIVALVGIWAFSLIRKGMGSR